MNSHLHPNKEPSKATCNQSREDSAESQTVTFQHWTIETGHSCEQVDFAPEPLLHATLMAWTSDGQHTLPDGYMLKVQHMSPVHTVFTVFGYGPDPMPVIVCHAYLDAPPTKCIQAAKTSLPQGRLLTVSLMPAFIFYPDAWHWLGDFERCFYWALWNRRRQERRVESAMSRLCEESYKQNPAQN